MQLGASAQCSKCKHLYDGPGVIDDEVYGRRWACSAFPDGIPYEIILAGTQHNKPYRGDNGIVFEEAGPRDRSILKPGWGEAIGV